MPKKKSLTCGNLGIGAISFFRHKRDIVIPEMAKFEALTADET